MSNMYGFDITISSLLRVNVGIRIEQPQAMQVCLHFSRQVRVVRAWVVGRHRLRF